MRRRGKQPEEQQPQRHPFALPHDPLQEAISELVGSLLCKSVGSSRLRLSLPSTAMAPQSSPELMLEKEPIDLKATGFKLWEVATLTLEPGNALDFLLALPNVAPRSIAFGSSLRFWMEAARFAFELIARQAYIPALEETRQDGALFFARTGR